MIISGSGTGSNVSIDSGSGSNVSIDSGSGSNVSIDSGSGSNVSIDSGSGSGLKCELRQQSTPALLLRDHLWCPGEDLNHEFAKKYRESVVLYKT